MNRPQTDAATVDLILTAAKKAAFLSNPLNPHMFKVRDVKRVIADMKGVSFDKLWKADAAKICGISGSRISWVLKLHPEMFKQVIIENPTTCSKHKVAGFIYVESTNQAKERVSNRDLLLPCQGCEYPTDHRFDTYQLSDNGKEVLSSLIQDIKQSLDLFLFSAQDRITPKIEETLIKVDNNVKSIYDVLSTERSSTIDNYFCSGMGEEVLE